MIREIIQLRFVVAEILWKLVVTRPCELVKTLPCVVIPSENSSLAIFTVYDYRVYGVRCHMEFT